MTCEDVAPTVKEVVIGWTRSLGMHGCSKPFYSEDGEPKAWLVNVIFYDDRLACNDRHGRRELFYADPNFCDMVERLLETGILGD